MAARRRKPLRITRDYITYAIGAGGLIYVILSESEDRVALAVAFIGLLALPPVIHRDEKAEKTEPPPTEKLPLNGETP